MDVENNLIAMWMHFADDFWEDDDECQWEKVTVIIDEFRVMEDPSFRMHFRLTKPQFEILLEEVGHSLVQANLLIRERRPLADRLLVSLWILATPDTFRSVALRFGVYPGEVHRYYLLTLYALIDLGPRYITWPSEEERIVIKENFERISGFHGIIGVMDGTHIPIPAPATDKGAFRDRHHGYSVKVQAVCDHRLLFRDVYVGEAGSLHDARVFRRSPLCFNILQQPDLISADEHIIADSAYMLLDKVMIPFENNGHLQPIQVIYNKRLSKSRVKVEHLFGVWKGIWRRLKELPAKNMVYAVDHITAFAVLHNFRILNGGILEAGAYVPQVAEDVGGIRNVDGAFQQGVHDHWHDPHVPQGDLAALLRNANMRGNQKRWDIANRLADLGEMYE